VSEHRPSPELVAHEEAHATVARWVGWTVEEVGYSSRGGSGFAKYLGPPADLGGWRELYVTLAGPVADTHSYAGVDPETARDVFIGQIARKAKRIGNGFEPKRDSDEWKAARTLVGMCDSPEEIERELRAAWVKVSSILDEDAAAKPLQSSGGEQRRTEGLGEGANVAPLRGIGKDGD
jgi:hypothetical protein